MTEAEWLACEDPRPLFFAFVGKHSRRKVLLFAVAGCAACRVRFTDGRCWAAVEVVERFADGLAQPSEVALVVAAANQALQSAHSPSDLSPGARRMGQVSALAAQALLGSASYANSRLHARASFARTVDAVEYARRGVKGGKNAQAQLLRDVFGNPFRPNAFSRLWRTDTALALASQMYESRDFSAMPILADALQDAGCDSDNLLSHCRGPGPHVRGCWVVDLVLGKG